jgi:four helix bundle protein
MNGEGEVTGNRARSYRDFLAWQKAIEFAVALYESTKSWPKEEQFGLINQVRRAAFSVPANIAEGQGRFGPNEWLRFLSIAHGSLCEVETHLFIAKRVGYLSEEQLTAFLRKADEIGRLVRGLSRSMRS